MAKPPTRVSIYWVEGTNERGEQAVVLNYRGKLKAAILRNGEFVRWLGALSRREEAPRRHCIDFLFPLKESGQRKEYS